MVIVGLAARAVILGAVPRAASSPDLSQESLAGLPTEIDGLDVHSPMRPGEDAAAATPPFASDMGLTGKTVSNYVSSILTKLQVADRAEAILRAREAGLGE